MSTDMMVGLWLYFVDPLFRDLRPEMRFNEGVYLYICLLVKGGVCRVGV